MVVDPDFERRNAVSGIVCSLRPGGVMPRVTLLADLGNPQSLRSQGFDVVLFAVDRNTEPALREIEMLCHDGSVSPIAYSEHTDDELLIRCMRAGVREFLRYPFSQGVVEDAFSRRTHSDQLARDAREVNGKSFVFLAAKGGSGVTTVASNFAVSLARESKRSTLLIDLDLPLGDTALCLGIKNEFSTIDALSQCERLDATYLAQLLSKHESGLHVLPAPGKYIRVPPIDESVNQLISIARKSFEYVVVDAGSRLELAETRLFDTASKIFVVSQVGVVELRNSNRLISEYLQDHGAKVEVVLNRYTSKLFGIDDETIEGALTRPVRWKIPNDFLAVRRMQHTAEPLQKSGIQREIKKMAAAAYGVREAKREEHRKVGGLLKLWGV
ncbi:MAG: AAA family ATPase [Terracidiphilus sp.]